MPRGWICPDVDDPEDPADPFSRGRDPDDYYDSRVGD